MHAYTVHQYIILYTVTLVLSNHTPESLKGLNTVVEIPPLVS
jgi:hypothetical protein